MAKLVAVQSGLALFRAGDVGVVVDVADLNPYDPQPLEAILATGEWVANADTAQVPAACQELAEAALGEAGLDVALYASGNDARLVRVPKRVQEAVQAGLTAARGDDSLAVSLAAATIAERLLTGVVTVEQVKRVNQHLTSAELGTTATSLLYGGDAGREWVAKVCATDGTTAAGAPESTDETLAAPVEYYATFSPDYDGGTNVKVDSVLARDPDGGWWLRELGEWSPTQAPSEDDELVMLDDESYRAVVAQLDEPGASFAELSLSEERLFELAEPTLDVALLDSVFAAMPFTPPAPDRGATGRQLRDSKGQPVVEGAAVQSADGERGTVASVDKDAGTVDVQGADGAVKTVPANSVTVDKNAHGSSARVVKARATADTVPVADVQGRLKKYANERTVVAAVDPLIPPDVPSPASPTPTATGPSAPVDDKDDDPVAAAGVTPLYLAEVDPQDTQAILELIAVVPSTGSDDPVDAYTREAGSWKPNTTILTQLTGPTPPPVVEVPADSVADIIKQVDGATAQGATPPVAAAGYALLQKFTLTAAGLTASQVRGALLLEPYGDELDQGVVDRLNELAEGGLDKNRGHAERLRRYWVHGEGAAKIQWGVPGDWRRCVTELGKYLGVRAKGYCALRHVDATGFWPGHAPTEQVPHGMKHRG